MDIDYAAIRANFILESTELLDRAEAAVLRLEKASVDQNAADRSADPAHDIQEIFRAVHTIKGNAGIFDLPAIQELSHALETRLGALREGGRISEVQIELLLACLDRLRALIESARDPEVEGDHGIDIGDLLRRLEDNDLPDGEDRQPTAPEIRERVSLPSGSLARAKAENKYLFLIALDLLAQDFGSLSTLNAFLDDLRTGEDLIQFKIRTNQLPECQAAPSLPAWLAVLSEEPAETFVKHRGLKARSIHRIHRPGGRPNGTPEGQKNPHNAQAADRGALIAANGNHANDKSALENAADASTSGTHSQLKVRLALIDRLINIAGETVVARNQLLQRLDLVGNRGLMLVGNRVGQLITQLQELIMQTRLQEINTVFHRLPRLVREVARSTGKQVELVVAGGEVELDKTLLDAIGDPLTHIIRNAIDHGMEAPADRQRAGKKEAGRIQVQAALRGGSVILTVQDDGRGLNIARIKQVAISRGLVQIEQAETLTEHEVAELVFLPGFSTAAAVTETSGRGVGMDVVRMSLNRVGGKVHLQSEAGRGTIVTMSLPQTLSVITCLMIRSGKRRFAIPQQNIVELVRVDPDRLSDVSGRRVYSLRGALLPLLELREVFGETTSETFGETADAAAGQSIKEERGAGNPDRGDSGAYITVVRTESLRFGLVIDDIINPEEIVIKPLGDHFADVRLFAGAAVLGDGEAVLILDVAGLASSASFHQMGALELDRFADSSPNGVEQAPASKFLLFQAGTQRFAVPIRTIPRIESIRPADIDTLVGARVIRYREDIVPLVDLSELFTGTGDATCAFMILFQIHNRPIGILASEILNVQEIEGATQESTTQAEHVIGQVVLEERTVLLLDAVGLLTDLLSSRFSKIRNVHRNQTQSLAIGNGRKPVSVAPSGVLI